MLQFDLSYILLHFDFLCWLSCVQAWQEKNMLQVRWGKWTWILWEWRKYFSLSFWFSHKLCKETLSPVTFCLSDGVADAVGGVGCSGSGVLWDQQVNKHLPLCYFAFIHSTKLQQEKSCSSGCHWSGFISCTAWPLNTHPSHSCSSNVWWHSLCGACQVHVRYKSFGK